MWSDKKKKSSVCTGIHGGSETSLNTVIHENVKVCYEPVCWIFIEIFVKFFQKLPSAYIFYKLYKSKFVICYRYWKLTLTRYRYGIDTEHEHWVQRESVRINRKQQQRITRISERNDFTPNKTKEVSL